VSKLGRLFFFSSKSRQTRWGLSAPVTVAQLLAVFQDSKSWKTSTIATMLDRIISKGFLRKELKGKAYYYSTIATLEEYQKQEGRNILSSLYGGSIKNFVAALAADGDVSKEDVLELQKWFQDSLRGEGKTK